ncbi:MAG: transposase, partial [Chloroflexales bacterium]|nr:transposase [Chloroflexales bacterium]
MLRERYDPMNLFEYIPALGMETDAVLSQLDSLLDDDVLFVAVKADLSRRFPRTSRFGRPSTPVEVILRLLVVKHLYHWSYEQAEQWVSDCLVLRQFCRLYTAKVPDDTTLLRWANLIQPATLERFLEHVVALARQHQVTRGRKLRLDSTVVETNVHYPVDSTLLADGVRVLARSIRRAKPIL